MNEIENGFTVIIGRHLFPWQPK